MPTAAPPKTRPTRSPARCLASQLRTGASHASSPVSVRDTGSAGARSPARARRAPQRRRRPRRAGDRIDEEQIRRCVDDKHVRRRDDAVRKGGKLQARIAQPPGEDREEDRLGPPCHGEAVPERRSAEATVASVSADAPSTRPKAGWPRRSTRQASGPPRPPASVNAPFPGRSPRAVAGAGAPDQRQRARASTPARRDPSSRR